MIKPLPTYALNMTPNNDTSSDTSSDPHLKGPGFKFGEDGLWTRILVFVAFVSLVASVFFLLSSRKRSGPLYGQVPKEAPQLNLHEDDDEEELFNATQHKLLRKHKITGA